MPGDVFRDERGDEEVRVIVPVLQAKRQLLSCSGTGLFEQLRLQLLREKLIGEALVHENIVEIAARYASANEIAGIVLAPCFAIWPKIGGERFLAPRTVHWRGDRRKRRDRAEEIVM